MSGNDQGKPWGEPGQHTEPGRRQFLRGLAATGALGAQPATTSAAARRQIEHEMQMIDFTQGGYIIPAYIDALGAYSTKITGYSPARVGQPLSDFDFENFSFA